MHVLYLALVCFYLAARVAEALDDTELAGRIKNGDRTAFRHFFDRYHGQLVQYLRRRGLDEESTLDIVQNAFIAIWERRDQIEPGRSLRAFLFRIGYTRALNHFRDHAKFDRAADLSLRPSEARTDDDVDFNLMYERLRKAIDTLPERRRAVFELCFLEQLTYKEAAQMLNVSVKTVENQMAHALKAIRSAMLEFKKQ